MRNLATWKAAMVIAVLAVVAACGQSSGNGGTASPAATGTARADSAICQDAAALRASLGNILSYQAGTASIAKLRANLGDAKTKLAALQASGHSAWSPQLTALETALKRLQTQATNPAVLTRPTAVTRALTDVRPKAQSFINAAKAQCPQL